MPATRKRTGGGTTAGTKKQKTATGAKKNLPNVKVDEGFTEDAKVHVQIDADDTIWDASLNLSNVSGNNNKFYVLQVLAGDRKKDGFFAHARWGRVGEEGQVKTTEHDNLDDAKKEFEKKFKEKSGLTWSDRNDKPKDKKYTYIEKSYEDDDDDDNTTVTKDNNGTVDVKSELDLPTQRLMELIFNENHFNAVLESMGYNQDKLPLGKLSKATLQTGFEQLKELSSLVRHPSLAKNKYNRDRKDVIEEWTNKYYSTIPHVFGRNRPPMIDNHEAIIREVTMLDNLSDMEVANTIMKATHKSKDGTSVSKLDRHFDDLNMKELTVLDHKSAEYQGIQKLLINTSSDGHNLRYRLQDVFRVERYGEAERFDKAIKKLKDRQTFLLWHGSRTTNYGGILSQGLRIAPPGPSAFQFRLRSANNLDRGSTEWLCFWQRHLFS